MISEVRRLLARAEPARAVLVGFETAMSDFEATFGLKPPPYWTYSDIFGSGIRTDMGYLPVLLARLYNLYEPVRYGRTRDVGAADLVAVLTLIYNEPSLRPVGGLPPAPASGVRVKGIPVDAPTRAPPPEQGPT